MTTALVSATKEEMKKNFLLDKLLASGVTRSQQGQNIWKLDYEELKYEWVLQSFKEVDAECSANAWF
ncbi:hypothetical protein ACFFF5_21160 [Lederbergia wuyishanensis]|uniref:Uncharacterized protein n=1 Tax=Lederbergia wuyishanensis TaxID=1347903 RepID=A0ABU0D752_9BACI|nr:hypothetical protein [Lederbergia wuyishanensis]MCJ8008926.1 hypothetical protein [Lederbergia wuyishanensis]MDQ0344252.1 hypothetical protein [Lederbergia wuyishanensis]